MLNGFVLVIVLAITLSTGATADEITDKSELPPIPLSSPKDYDYIGKAYQCKMRSAAGYAYSEGNWVLTNFDVSKDTFVIRRISPDDISDPGETIEMVMAKWA